MLQKLRNALRNAKFPTQQNTLKQKPKLNANNYMKKKKQFRDTWLARKWQFNHTLVYF